MILADTGLPTPLELTLFDGDATKGVRAFVRRSNGTLVTTVDLPHLGNGTYMATYTHMVPEFLQVTFVVYGDDTFTEVDDYYAVVSEIYRFKNEPSVRFDNKVTVAFNQQTGAQELLCWSEKDGAVALGTKCRVAVKKSDGDVVYSAALEDPNADGVFHFVNPSFSGEADKNYYVSVTIEVEGADRTSYQSFFTVG